MPMVAPTMNAQTTGVIPRNRLSRVPTMSRLSMSRPSSSVPSTWPGVPMGFKRLNMLAPYGSAGASSGPKVASTSRRRIINAATMATRSRRKRQPTVCQ